MPDFVMEGECKPVQLEPFVHQVGGHSSMLRFDDTTVCKPLISRERHFYEAMPPEIQEFVPQYRGVVEVTFQEDSNGYMTLIAYPPECKKTKKRTVKPSSSPSSSGEGVQSDSDNESPTPCSRPNVAHRFRMRQSGSIEIEGRHDKMFQLVDPHSKTSKDISKATHNPWSLRCHQEQLAKMKKNSNSCDVHKFILLENLASNFNLPCILDLKMGTRQHGDDASEEKRQSQIKKCAATTSSTLGVRICGMQVYQANTGHYICHNKYYGRRLSADGVEEALVEFLHNGYGLRLDLIDSILERLRKLYSMLAKQIKFRFYSSSLLIMYDGGKGDIGGPPPADHLLSGTPSAAFVSAECSNQNCGCSAAPAGPACEDRPAGALCRRDNAPQSPGQVDVRMIDFAHATHQGFRGDRTVHTGPDEGYLFGLENIIRMLESLKHQGARRS